MKKLLTLLLIIACVLSLSACNKSSVAEIGDKDNNNNNVEVDWNEDYVFVDIDSVNSKKDVKYSTSNGTQITVSGNVDYSTAGKYPATISYTNSSGNVVEKETYIVVDNSNNKDTVAEEIKTEVDSKKMSKYDVVIEGKTWNLSNLNEGDLNTAIAWAEAVYGEGCYEVKNSPKGQMAFIDFDKLTCEEIGMIKAAKNAGAKISVNNHGDISISEKINGC